MRNQNIENRVALCDREAEYVDLLTEFLNKNGNLPWKIYSFTDPGELIQSGVEQYDLLVVAESAYDAESLPPDAHRIVILSESGLRRWDNVTYVDKYQPAEAVRKELLQKYIELSEGYAPTLQKQYEAKRIGFFTPIHRCLQSTFAMTLGQLLAEEHKVLYLSFEAFSGSVQMQADENTYDLADLLFFLGADREKFALRLEVTTKRVGNLAYIPSMKVGQNLLGVTPAMWQNLLQAIEDTGAYEYILLDLSDCVQGVFDILQTCSKVLTLTAGDAAARAKLYRYEQLLEQYECRAIAEKTEKVNLPRLQNLPEDPTLLVGSELAKVAQRYLNLCM